MSPRPPQPTGKWTQARPRSNWSPQELLGRQGVGRRVRRPAARSTSSSHRRLRTRRHRGHRSSFLAPGISRAPRRRRPGDHVDVDAGVGGEAQELAHDRAPAQLLPPAAPGGPHHDLGDLVLAGELDHCTGRVVPGHLQPRPADVLHQPAQRRQGGDVGGRVAPGHVHGQAGRPSCRLAMRAARRTTPSLPGAPVTATRIRSTVSQTGPGVVAPGSPRARRRSRRPRSAAPARAGPPGSRS